MKVEDRGKALEVAARFYDGLKHGYRGTEGYRKSTDSHKLIRCARALRREGVLDPERTVFLDLGCADGRVNVLMSYFVKRSLGIEIDGEFLAEYAPRREKLVEGLREAGLPGPPDNVFLMEGDSLEEATYEIMRKATGTGFRDVDLFYTYITLHDLLGERIARHARRGALYWVYGFSRVLPAYEGLKLRLPDVGDQGVAALYEKI